MSFPLSLRHGATLLAGLALSFAVQAHEYKIGELTVEHPWARTTVPGQPAGGAYLNIENKGTHSDKLLGATSPAAKSVEIHTMSMDGNVMKMREVGTIEIKPSEKITMQPGNGYHIMLMGLSQQLKAGDKIPLTLSFEKGGKIDVMLFVEDNNGAKAMPMDHVQH